MASPNSDSKRVSFAGLHRLRLRAIWPALVLFFLACGVAGKPDLARYWGFLSYPGFIDAAVITAGAETVRHGLDPLVVNPFDQYRRPMNYPRVWQSLAAVLGRESTHVLALVFWLAFFLALGAFLWNEHTRVPPLLALVYLCSPCVLLILDRANSDILIFALLVGAVYTKRQHWLLAYSLWLFAVVLKLYPLFAAPFLFTRINRKHVLIAALLAGGVFVYELAHWSDFAAIARATPAPLDGYGRMSLLMNKFVFPHGAPMAVVWATRVALVLPIVLAYVIQRSMPTDASEHGSEFEDLFIVGGGVFAGSYFFSSNYDYRMVWLILCLPLLFHLWRSRKAVAVGLTGSALIAGALWCLLLDLGMFLATRSPASGIWVNQSLKWACYVLVGALLIHLLIQRSCRVLLRGSGESQ